ncbi:hypothetical protein HN51_056228, partial [Arachis hypogaea]
WGFLVDFVEAIMEDKPAFIFCVEDRALFCKDCDELIHLAGSLSANHQRFLATGIRVALGTNDCSKSDEKSHLEPSIPAAQQVPRKKQADEFGELEWLADVGIFGEQFPLETLAAVEVPQLPMSHTSTLAPYTFKATNKSYMSSKKPRIEVVGEIDDEHFTVPDLG